MKVPFPTEACDCGCFDFWLAVPEWASAAAMRGPMRVLAPGRSDAPGDQRIIMTVWTCSNCGAGRTCTMPMRDEPSIGWTTILARGGWSCIECGHELWNVKPGFTGKCPGCGHQGAP